MDGMQINSGHRRHGDAPGPVTQPWMDHLTFMQQSVLITAIRGPDTIRKNHISKFVIRWLRRCTLICSFGNEILTLPYDPGERKGGSFTGPSLHADVVEGRNTWQDGMDNLIKGYLSTVDELPHHFQLHFMHAAEILGYKHPLPEIRAWWHKTYLRLVNDAHLVPEPEDVMDRRLGDNENDWRAAEEVTAREPDKVFAEPSA